MKPILLLICFPLIIFSCTKPPYKPDFKNVKGYVIGNEICTGLNEYWLIDLTYLPNTPQYGDTLVLNGTTYTNVVKTKDLKAPLTQVGKAISLDFKTITSNNVQTTGCTLVNPITYNLKELFIINQGEIR